MKYIFSLVFVTIIALKTTAQFSDAKNVQPLTAEQTSERLLKQFKQLAFLPVTNVNYQNIIKGRANENANPIPTLTNADSVNVTFTEIPGLNSGDPEIPVRIYKSKVLSKAPIYIYFHGGGFVGGTLNWDHQRCANIAQKGGAVVISVDYRLAPENIFPAGFNDCYAALLWSVKHADEIGGDTAHIAIAGTSAGAALAGGVVLKARDENGPKIRLQVLEIPPSDLDTSRVSTREFYSIAGLKGADISVLMKMYVGEKNYKTPLPKYLMPGLAESITGLPATFIATAGVDPLRDGGLAYAIRLIEAGIPVELHNYAGYAHGMALPGYDVELYRVMNEFLK